jgi:hypothetical protein
MEGWLPPHINGPGEFGDGVFIFGPFFFFPSMLLHALFSFLFWLKFAHKKNIYVYWKV